MILISILLPRERLALMAVTTIHYRRASSLAKQFHPHSEETNKCPLWFSRRQPLLSLPVPGTTFPILSLMNSLECLSCIYGC